MLKKISLWLMAAAMLTACGQNNAQTFDPNSSDPAKDGKHFGAIITADNAISYDEVIEKMTALQIRST